MGAIEVSYMFDGSPVYGREDDEKSIVRLVLSDDCKTHNVTFIRILAESGTGKSTMVHLVYNEEAVCDAFDARIFINVSGMFDENSLMKEMIESLTSLSCRETEVDQLEDILVDELIGKRILLVLDNAENEYHFFWNYVETLLNHGSNGSVVITTGRKLVNYVMVRYDLNPLSDYYSWLLFERYAFRDLNINAYPELVRIGKQIIAKCLNHPLCIKVLGGLLSCSQNQQFWIAISMFLECAYPGVDPLLTMCYNLMPMHLQKCIGYLSLFPKGYIFLKHRTVCIWISAGLIIPVEGIEPEVIGAQYFDELLCRAFIEHSHIQNAEEDKFIMHEHIHNLAEYSARHKCFKLDDGLIRASGNHIHFSLVPSEFRTDIVIPMTENLQTFLVVSRCSLPGRIFPILNLIDLNKIFTKSICLTTLDLSYTNIVELPGSIGLLKKLSYLGVSNTKITSLPIELCTIVSLQTLEAKECYHLTELPENLNLLTNLRHLDVIKKSGFVKMPVGIGQLTNLRILTTFNVSGEKQHCEIKELKGLNYLKGCLQIAGLENIESGISAKEANLKNKMNLETLCLQWNKTNRDDQSAIVSKEVFENMEPNNRLKEVIVRNYIGNQFPAWIGDSSFTDLVSIIIDKCTNCSRFPSLGALPFLRKLSVQKMYHVKTLETTGCKFQSLEILNIWEMYDLEELFELRDGDFPRLHTLSINRCPVLKNIPCFPFLMQISIYCCIKLPYIPDLPSLESMKIDGFQKIKSIDLPCNLPTLKCLEIRHCSELLLVEKLSNFSSLKKLIVDSCPKFASLYGWVRLDLKAKRYCFIKEEDEDDPKSKRRKRIHHNRTSIKIRSSVDFVDDGYRWRKYGQKTLEEFPSQIRSYYKCTHLGCSGKKRVERCSEDLSTLIITYEGAHNHQKPLGQSSNLFPNAIESNDQLFLDDERSIEEYQLPHELAKTLDTIYQVK